ncbi:MAG: helix-turn-helix transcriptional regulator [Nannocystales bacterium]
MGRHSDGARIERLRRLEAMLRSGEPTTIEDLAADLGTSARTIRRDLSLLREQGVPVESERGRGGGVRIDQNWGVGRLQLNYEEAVDLLVSLAVAEQMRSPLLMAELVGVRRKLMASFSSEMKARVRRLKARILVGPSVHSGLLAGHGVVAPRVAARLHQAFFEQRSLSVTYESEHAELTKRRIQPHYLMLCHPIWYVLAWDELRDDVRTFRCDRIQQARLGEGSFRLRPRSRFEPALAGIQVL